jgi:hypothetical protein
MEPDSCGSARNTFAALSSSAWVVDCKSAAANYRGCCCRTAYRVASAVARGRCCRWARKAAMPGHWSWMTARLRVPKADDWLGCRGLIAPGNFLTGSSFQNQLADGLGHSSCPALPKCVDYCPGVATQRCQQQRWACDRNSAVPRAAGFAKAGVVAATSPVCSAYSLAGHSLPAHCALERSVFLCVDSSPHSPDGLPGCSPVRCQYGRR